MTLRFKRYVAIGDSSTEGLQDPDGAGGYHGWADRLAERVAQAQGGLLYANLGVRGKRSWEIREEQLGPALAMKPDLATVFAGSNDILERGFNSGKLRAELGCMMGALVGGKAVVLTFTLPDLTNVMPIGRYLAPRIRSMNETIREAAASTGARLIDFAAYPGGSDPRLWSEDRFHVNAEGHARIAAALAQALGLPGTDDAWQQPMPERNARSRRTRMAESWSWYRHHLLERLAEANRSLRPGGRVVLAEHMRDPANFLAFGPGFLHFHSLTSWRRCWESAGLRWLDHFPVTPFVQIIVLTRP